MIGRHLILGFDGLKPTDDFLRLVHEEEIGGVILFQRNVESRAQVKELIHTLEEARGTPMIVSVDHEGGRVFRLPEPFTKIPPARLFGRYYERTNDLDLIVLIASLIAGELRDVGFNLNFAPVLDVDSCPENPIIGDRSFHQDPQIVAEVALAFIKGFEKGGLVSCGKHFPGHGDTKEDSHKTLPEVLVDRDVLESRELIPFIRVIKENVPALMTAHVLYTAYDPKSCATLSPRINRDLLRDQLNFQGVLFSDDLFMKGVAPDLSGVPEVAVKSFLAGCDMLLLCHNEVVQRETIHFLNKEVQISRDLKLALKESSPRVERLLSRVTELEPIVREPMKDEGILLNKLAQLGL